MTFNEPEENLCSSAQSVGDKRIIRGSMELKIGEMLGGVGEKIYLCITLSCTRQIESKLSLHSLAKCLHKIGGISAIETSFIAFDLHNLCKNV